MSRKFGQRQTCEEAVSHLLNKGINFLALDFDQTIIDIHTGGRFKGTTTELARHVRPMFAQLITCAHDAGINIGIVTFSPQVQQIGHVMEIMFPEFAHEIVIRGRDRSFHYEGNGMKEGKQPFMASAVEEIMTKNTNLVITKNTTLLVDDDADNIELALRDGVRAIVLDPDRSQLLVRDIISMP
eukprot:CAMPEP_0194107700 /NCGR_PEP_ID=MMETSP0150-20130528/7519_1 /TAXON_ID=122233 /ORGANISM="Chaetoceros debilis, Strain MM31A-1" /LENGTH=183 /DNA_ID=CAMNT_0038796183 /DNA_START=115 /DNA_END=666 /DNA_ORIENTATION=+